MESPHQSPPELIRQIFDTEDHVDILSGYAEEIADSPIEIAVVATRDGNLYRCKGTKNGIFPNYDLGEKIRGADIIHNHPVGSNNEYSFSDGDIKLFAEYELNTLIGVDELFVYILDRGSIIDEPTPIMDFDKYSARHENVILTAKGRGFGYRRYRHG